MQVNDKAAEFNMLDENSQKVALKDYRGRNIVLYFFPKADTPG
jgi:peroxiredoxin Q/BCP